jgi:hypothetical protein
MYKKQPDVERSDRGGQRLAILLKAGAEMAHRVGLVSEVLENRRDTGKRAFAFQT